MTRAGSVYGEALYTLARDENLSEAILKQLNILDGSFCQEPGFVQLLGSYNLPKNERCQILNNCFQGKLHPYLLNFLKILTEKGYMHQFSNCAEAYRGLYNQDNGILPVTAVTAVALDTEQTAKLTKKLAQITGKRIALTNQTDPAVLGGIRLDYNGKCVDNTVSHRLDAMRNLLKNTML